jgi:hypothetical protein
MGRGHRVSTRLRTIKRHVAPATFEGQILVCAATPARAWYARQSFPSYGRGGGRHFFLCSMKKKPAFFLFLSYFIFISSENHHSLKQCK